jgi:hypothetical protein
MLVLPVVAIEQDILVLYVAGGVLYTCRIIPNRSCNLVLNPSAHFESGLQWQAIQESMAESNRGDGRGQWDVCR